MFSGAYFRVLVATICLYLVSREVIAANDFHHEICQRTTDSNLCVATIEADTRQNLKTTSSGLCRVFRDKAVTSAALTIPKILDLLKSESNTLARQSLETCLKDYKNSVYDLNSVDFTVINRTKYGQMIDVLGIARETYADCDKSFTEHPGTPPSPLTSENKDVNAIIVLVEEILNLSVCNTVNSC